MRDHDHKEQAAVEALEVAIFMACICASKPSLGPAGSIIERMSASERANLRDLTSDGLNRYRASLLVLDSGPRGRSDHRVGAGVRGTLAPAARVSRARGE